MYIKSKRNAFNLIIQAERNKFKCRNKRKIWKIINQTIENNYTYESNRDKIDYLLIDNKKIEEYQKMVKILIDYFINVGNKIGQEVE